MMRGAWARHESEQAAPQDRDRFPAIYDFPHLAALEYVSLATRIVLKLPRREAEARAKKQLKRVGLTDKMNERSGRLSGGRQQRLAIACALAMQSNYLPFDEITSGLDLELAEEVLDALRVPRPIGMALIRVTHEMRFAREMADRIVYMVEGPFAR